MAQQALQIEGRDATELVIWWNNVTEFAPLKSITGAPDQEIETLERWDKEDGTPIVSYVAKVDEFLRKGKKTTLRLRYELPQPDERVSDSNNGTRWGVSVIKWDTSGLTGSAEWIDEDDATWNVRANKVTMLFGPNTVEDRVKNATSVIARPKQTALRAALLMKDKTCVLTGEKEATALEAAHIIPVKARGVESIYNAILLRADLHRLFDVGLFWFELSSDEAVVRPSFTLSDMYNKILTGKKLPDSIFVRVERALRHRAELLAKGARH